MQQPTVIVAVHASSDSAAASIRQVLGDLLAEVALPGEDVQVIPIFQVGSGRHAYVLPGKAVIDVISPSKEISDLLAEALKELSSVNAASGDEPLCVASVTYSTIHELQSSGYSELEISHAEAEPHPKLTLVP